MAGGTSYGNGYSSGSVSNGGTISGTSSTDSNGDVTISGLYARIGGRLSNATAAQYGAIVVSGGTGTNLAATSGGALLTVANGVISGANVGSSAALFSFEYGSAVAYNVAAGGQLYVGDQSVNPTTSAILTSKGVSSDNLGGPGMVSGGTLQNGGLEIITSGGTDKGSVIQGTQYVSAGGITLNDVVNSGGVQTLYSGAVTTGTIVGSGGTTVASGGATVSATVISGGNVLLNAAAIVRGAVVSSGGQLTVSSGATASNVTVSSGGTESILSGGTASGGTVLKGGNEVVASGATALNVTVSSGGSLTVAAGSYLSGTQVAQGAVIDVDTLAYASGGTVKLDGNTLTISEGGSTWQTTFAGTFKSTDYFVLSRDTDGSTIATFVCFCAGTLILTEDGEKLVEDLQIGDRAVTYVAGREVIQPITWVGHRTAQVRTDLPADQAGYPVRILKDAISPGVPHKDLVVTPEHCLYFEGRFVPARMLVNGRSVFYDLTMTNYEYFHVETENHSILWSNGALSESYLDTGNRREFGQQGGVVRLVSGPVREWSVDAAAPLAVTRDLVEPIYRALEERAVEMSIPDQRKPVVLTEDANLHLVTSAGHRINAARRSENGDFVFMLPAGVDEVHIVSRASRPADVFGPVVDDRRYLGVLVGGISLWAGNGQKSLTAHITEDELSGWNNREEGGVRWTNGNAVLKLPARQDLSIAVLTIEVKNAGPYLLEDETDNVAVIAS